MHRSASPIPVPLSHAAISAYLTSTQRRRHRPLPLLAPNTPNTPIPSAATQLVSRRIAAHRLDSSEMLHLKYDVARCSVAERERLGDFDFVTDARNELVHVARPDRGRAASVRGDPQIASGARLDLIARA